MTTALTPEKRAELRAKAEAVWSVVKDAVVMTDTQIEASAAAYQELFDEVTYDVILALLDALDTSEREHADLAKRYYALQKQAERMAIDRLGVDYP